MTEQLYEAMGMPDACRIDRRVYKKLFFENENARFTSADKKLFGEHVESICWRYTLKPETTNIAPYEDDEREYHEIAVLEVILRKPDKAERLANLAHRAIPYPIILVLAHNSLLMLHLAPKRANRADSAKWTLESEHFTHWLDLSKPSDIERACLQELDLRQLRLSSLFVLYTDLVECVTSLNCAKVTGKYTSSSGAGKQTQRSEALAAHGELKEELGSYRVALAEETQFNRQVELNMKIKETVRRMDGLKSQL